MPRRLRRMTSGPDDFRAAFNGLVEAVRDLQKMSASPPLGLAFIGGVPTLRMLPIAAGGALRIGKTDASCATESSTTVSIWKWDGSDFVDSEENVTAYNWFSTTIASGAKVIVAKGQDDGLWYFVAEDC